MEDLIAFWMVSLNWKLFDIFVLCVWFWMGGKGILLNFSARKRKSSRVVRFKCLDMDEDATVSV